VIYEKIDRARPSAQRTHRAGSSPKNGLGEHARSCVLVRSSSFEHETEQLLPRPPSVKSSGRFISPNIGPLKSSAHHDVGAIAVIVRVRRGSPESVAALQRTRRAHGFFGSRPEASALRVGVDQTAAGLARAEPVRMLRTETVRARLRIGAA